MITTELGEREIIYLGGYRGRTLKVISMRSILHSFNRGSHKIQCHKFHL